MWTSGLLNIVENGKVINIRYTCKNYSRPSEDYGIDGSKISKLSLVESSIDPTRDGKRLYDYDRGLVLAPQSEAAREALQYIKKMFN